MEPLKKKEELDQGQREVNVVKIKNKGNLRGKCKNDDRAFHKLSFIS